MTPDQACKFCVPFGKHRGKTLEQVATTDQEGPGYLDWMVGLKDLSPDLKEALECFLAIHWVKELVEQSVEKHTPRVSSEPVENLKKPGNWWERKK